MSLLTKENNTDVKCQFNFRNLFILHANYIFQSYSLATIGYRVATFNDCDEAAESLKQVSL